ncbi:MAG: 4-alpha-glucanotransferase, partial [Chlamydiia bacterium]|nr:4-alpha-glucanotransferase [Chlamydiia bacterium]
IGEFLDLLGLIDWCAEVGMDVIQLLPLNDSGPDSSPYSALSSCALNPIYLSLHALPGLHASPMELTALTLEKRVNYRKVLNQKRFFLRQHYSEQIEALTHNPDYQKFVANNSGWLIPYALFKTIKEEREWRSWKTWPDPIHSPSEETIRELSHTYRHKITHHCALQYLCFQQMEEVREYAEEKGVLIKGDIPILISPESADVWAERRYFNTQLSAGAPPDMYATEGQHWGFPLFNWKSIEASDWNWWRRRLHVAQKFYHIYRLDHIVGFFRLWGIEPGKTPKEGVFVPSDPSQWIPQGKKILELMLETSTMLPIGEDLGIVPPEVRHCLHDLGISGTKVMRWERKWDHGADFVPVEDYPADSMTTVSTHDSETLQEWWCRYPDDVAAYCKHRHWCCTEQLSPEQHRSILSDSHHSDSLFHINLITEYLDFVPNLCWHPPEENRMNVPGTVSDRNWSLRLRVPIEEIRSNNELREALASVLEN